MKRCVWYFSFNFPAGLTFFKMKRWAKMKNLPLIHICRPLATLSIFVIQLSQTSGQSHRLSVRLLAHVPFILPSIPGRILSHHSSVPGLSLRCPVTSTLVAVRAVFHTRGCFLALKNPPLSTSGHLLSVFLLPCWPLLCLLSLKKIF